MSRIINRYCTQQLNFGGSDETDTPARYVGDMEDGTTGVVISLVRYRFHSKYVGEYVRSGC